MTTAYLEISQKYNNDVKYTYDYKIVPIDNKLNKIKTLKIKPIYLLKN